MIQITGGTWRGRTLAGFPKSMSPQAGFRPTTGRVREALFSMLAQDLPKARVLDGFAGTGALGFEALSRGASFAMAIESHPAAARLAAENAHKLQLNADRWQLHAMTLDSALTRVNPDRPFDLMLLDPPYELMLNPDALSILMQPPWGMPDRTRIVIEQGSRGGPNDALLKSLGLTSRIYGSTTLWLSSR